MPVFRSSRSDTYEGKGATYRSPVEVRLENGSIAVSYQDNGRTFVYEGQEVGLGYFNVACAAVNGRATLHRVPNENVLEGWWFEGGYEGMWRSELEE